MVLIRSVVLRQFYCAHNFMFGDIKKKYLELRVCDHLAIHLKGAERMANSVDQDQKCIDLSITCFHRCNYLNSSSGFVFFNT